MGLPKAFLKNNQKIYVILILCSSKLRLWHINHVQSIKCNNLFKMYDQAYSLLYEVVLMYLVNETKIVDHKDGEKIDEHP